MSIVPAGQAGFGVLSPESPTCWETCQPQANWVCWSPHCMASVDAALHGPSDLGVYSRPSASSTPDTWAPRPVPDQTGHTPAPGPLHLLLPRPGINTRLTSFRSLLKRHLVSAAFRGRQCHTPLPGLPSSLLHLSSSFSTRQRMTFQKIKLIMSVSCLKTCLGPHFL